MKQGPNIYSLRMNIAAASIKAPLDQALVQDSPPSDRSFVSNGKKCLSLLKAPAASPQIDSSIGQTTRTAQGLTTRQQRKGRKERKLDSLQLCSAPSNENCIDSKIATAS